MCQLFAVSSAERLRVNLSWEGFALRGSEALGNPDGWGVAYADGNDVHLSREQTPAADSALVSFLGNHGPASTTLVSHIRRATVGDRRLANTQPFVRTLGGRTHVFAHNGHVSLEQAPFGPWLRSVGTTDSETMFCELLQSLEPLWRTCDAPDLDLRSAVVTDFAKKMRSLGAANFLYHDGLTLFAHGHRRTIAGSHVSDDPGMYYLLMPTQSEAPKNVPCHGVDCIGAPCARAFVATVPLDGQAWTPFVAGETLRIEHGVLV